MQAHATAKSFAISDAPNAASQINTTPSDDQQQAFAKTFSKLEAAKCSTLA
jgi:hypothetical protein